MDRKFQIVLVFVLACCYTASNAQTIKSYEWKVSLSTGSPSCYERPVILVNDAFRPTLEVVQGETIAVGDTLA
jgi:hypothetical protein